MRQKPPKPPRQPAPAYEFLEINSAFERLTGLKREAVVGRRVTEVIPGIRASAFDWIGTYGKVALTGQATTFEEYSEALQRWYSVVAFSNKPGEFAVLFHDVTERVKAEAAVRRLNADLQQRAAELESAIKELEGFSYTVSHDLRAPLRAMDGFSRILLDEHAQGLTPEGERYLRLVRQNSQQMGALIDDLLAFSRLSRQPLKRQTVSLADLVADAWETLRHERQGRVVELTVADLPPCQGDPTLLRQVWLNLLSNALKFTRRKETGRIEVGCLKSDEWRVTSDDRRDPTPVTRSPSPVTYFVRDNGVGFDMRHADKLFGVFQRLHRSEEYEGTGVGLAIVQRIVHRHGGRVWVEAEVERGATFYFTL